MSQSLEDIAVLNHGDDGYEYDYYSDEYVDGRSDYEMASESMDLLHISKSCVLPTLTQVSILYLQMFTMCFGLQILNKLPFIGSTMKHAMSFLFGFIALYLNFRILISHFVVISLVSYVLIYLLKFSTLNISVGLLTYLTAWCSEFIFEGAEWARIRSIQMILIMKIISLKSDLKIGTIQKTPSPTQFFGYLFSPSNCIYGPWMTFSSYEEMISPRKWNANNFSRIAMSTVSSLICFVLSTCYLDWLLPDDFGWNLSFMYKQAIIFRTSHYFVMLMSQAFCLAAGHDIDSFVYPSRIEIPRSVVEVVIYWNVPMHKWLKMYVFKPLWGYGRFMAIIGTYFVSSLLHGFNYQLSGVLLSLAIYTYIEEVLRKKMARRLNACILSRSCLSECHVHVYTHRFSFVKLINLLFTALGIFHLSYLGCLIDLHNNQKISFKQSFQRWHDLSYSGHLIALGMTVINLSL